MAGFNIKTLLNLDPPEFQCIRCLAFLPNNYQTKILICPVCRLTFVNSGVLNPEYTNYDRMREFYRTEAPSLTIDYKNITDHCKRLAVVANRFDGDDNLKRDIYFQALNEAKYFVHFMTWGNVGEIFQSAFKMISLRKVRIRGITANSNRPLEFKNSFFGGYEIYNISNTATSNGYRDNSMPHQKITIIDGLLMFKGSANLSKASWEAADADGELIEISTNLDEIVKTHNKLFSPWWQKVCDHTTLYKEEYDILKPTGGNEIVDMSLPLNGDLPF
jgi:hypothetical protein